MSDQNNEMESESVDVEVDAEVEALDETPEPQPEVVRKVKLKIDKEEIDEELPFDVPKEHEEYIKKQLQLAKVAQRRMQAAAESEKRITQMEDDIRGFLTALKEDPISVLSDPNLSVDLKAVAQKIMNEELEEAAKDPAQKEKEALEKRLKQLEDEKAKLERDSREKELKAEEDRIAASLEKEITDAIKANDLPEDPEVLGLIAKNLKIAMKFNLALSANDVIPVVKKELYEKAKHRLSLLSDEELYDFIGEDRLNNIRKNMIKSLKKQTPPVSAKQIKDNGGGVKEINSDEIFNKGKKTDLKSRDFFKNPLKYST